MKLLKKIIKLVLPRPIVEKYRELRKLFEPVSTSFPVVQIYLNDDEFTSVAAFNNYLSVLAPKIKSDGFLEVEIYDLNGSSILKKNIKINSQETIFLNLKTELSLINGKSPMGLIAMQFIPRKLRSSNLKELGLLSAHFFMMYSKQSDKGFSVIHPSSTLDPASEESFNFRSNQLVSTDGLSSVVLFQANPSLEMLHTYVRLVTPNDNALMLVRKIEVPPRGVTRVDLSVEDLPEGRQTPPFLRLVVDKLPTSNSKPMLCRVYKDGRFSMSHS